MFDGERVFRVTPATVTILFMSIWRDGIIRTISAQHLRSHICLLDAVAERNFVSSAFIKKGWLECIRKHNVETFAVIGFGIGVHSID